MFVVTTLVVQITRNQAFKASSQVEILVSKPGQVCWRINLV